MKISLGDYKMIKICETCVWDYVKKLIELEQYMPSWNRCKTDELLFAIGERQTQRNIHYMNLARKRL